MCGVFQVHTESTSLNILLANTSTMVGSLAYLTPSSPDRYPVNYRHRCLRRCPRPRHIQDHVEGMLLQLTRPYVPLQLQETVTYLSSTLGFRTLYC
jgi:hypothetical protein